MKQCLQSPGPSLGLVSRVETQNWTFYTHKNCEVKVIYFILCQEEPISFFVAFSFL